jgi:hypothetical protein
MIILLACLHLSELLSHLLDSPLFSLLFFLWQTKTRKPLVVDITYLALNMEKTGAGKM